MTKEDTQEQARKFAEDMLTPEQRNNPTFMSAFEAGLGQPVKKDTQVEGHIADVPVGADIATQELMPDTSYIVVDALFKIKLIEKVREFTKVGYKPLGGVCSHPTKTKLGATRHILLQAMIKE